MPHFGGGVSIVRIVCLSPRVTMDRSKKLINPFVSETTESDSVLLLCMYFITVVIDIIIAVSSIQHKVLD